MRFFASALVCLALLLGACSGSSDSGSSDSGQATAVSGGLSLPLAVGRSKSDRRATISTSIEGVSQTLLFDTGSTGMSVIATSVPDSVASMTGQPFQEPFGDGVLLSGVIVLVPVVVDGNATSGPIAIRLVQSATCDSGNPKCAAAKGLDSFSSSIGADGIFGAGLWADGVVFSPLSQLAWGTPTSIAVTWNGGSGSVTLNPTFDSASVASLQMPAGSPASLPNGVSAWSNLSVPVCWQIGVAQRTCTPTALDTGASALSFPINFPGGPTTNVKRLPSGERISASATETASPFLTLTTGKKLGTDLVTVLPGESSVDSGLQFFHEFVVTFSIAEGTVLLYPGS